MATTTATKPKLPSLKTPMSATYPSEIRSPMVATPTWMKREDVLGALAREAVCAGVRPDVCPSSTEAAKLDIVEMLILSVPK